MQEKSVTTHAQTFTQKELCDMLISAWLMGRTSDPDDLVSKQRNYFNMLLSQNFFLQQREARHG